MFILNNKKSGNRNTYSVALNFHLPQPIVWSLKLYCYYLQMESRVDTSTLK